MEPSSGLWYSAHGQADIQFSRACQRLTLAAFLSSAIADKVALIPVSLAAYLKQPSLTIKKMQHKG